jgi:TonB-dependent receptor
MMVTKSFSAELSADFTGGAVNVKTKDFPEEKVFEISLGLGYTPGMHFNKNYISANEGGTDFLGFDDGTRAIPELAKQSEIPSPITGHTGEEVHSFLRSFNPNLSVKEQQSLPDMSVGLSLANQKQIGAGQNKLGYLFSLSYKNETEFLDDVFYGEYQRYPDDVNKYEMRYATEQNGAIGSNNVLLAGLGGVSLKTQNSKYKLTLMHLQNGESQAGMFDLDNNGEAVGQSGYIARSENLSYTQRSLTNAMINGVHHIKKSGIEVDWRISPTLSQIEDPDIRKTAFTITPTKVFFSAGAAGLPNRIWRNLDEVNVVGKVDVSKDYTLFEESASLKVGASHIYKDRDYEILSFDMQFFGAQPDFGGNSENVMRDEYLYPNGTTYYSSANNDPNPNAYQGNVNNSGVYIANEFRPLSRLKVTLGVRAEQYVMKHTGRDIDFANSGVGNNFDNEVVLDDLDVFPMANLILSLSETQNLRFAYSRTIARPTFKELSFAQILDPLTNRYFNGGLYAYPDWDGKLGSSRIQNADLRWEMFFGQAQLVSFGVFYKSFDDPIELVRIPQQQTTTEYQPRNVGQGDLYGTEIELRRNLTFLPGVLDKLTFSTNVTLVRSTIKMTESEFNSRKQYERAGETVTDTRRMAGQAPYIINGGFSYEGDQFEVGLFYNVKGPTLSIVGGGLFPDVYVNPFHSLNFNANINLGSADRASLNVSVSNLLNDQVEEVYTSFNAEDQVYSRYSPGISFGIGVKYNLAK